MGADTTRDTIARLEAELRTMSGKLAEHETILAPGGAQSRTRRKLGGRAGRRAATLVVAGMLGLVPLSLWAANPVFTDLNSAADVHRNNIQAIGNAGITQGFADPNNPNQRLYFPKDNVTREEMASFLARTAGLGGNPPVANAATVAGLAPSGIARVARADANNDFLNQGAPGPTAITTQLPNYTPFATVSIEAPGDGFVLVTGTSGVATQNTDVVYMRLRNTTAGAPANAVSPTQLFFTDTVGAPAGAVSAFGTLSSTYVFPVTGAGTKTFLLELTGQNASTTDSTGFSTSVTAIFVPFGNSGGSGLANPPSPAGSGEGVPQPWRDRLPK